MNADRLNLVADAIEALPWQYVSDQDISDSERAHHRLAFTTGMQPNGFSMKTWCCYGTECGTVGCIAGVTAMLFPPANTDYPNAPICHHAQEVLDLHHDDALSLFEPNPDRRIDYKLISPAQAAHACRLVAAETHTPKEAWEDAIDNVPGVPPQQSRLAD